MSESTKGGTTAALYVNCPGLLGHFLNYFFAASLSGQTGSRISWLGVKMPGVE
jgi:hypothetical protein